MGQLADVKSRLAKAASEEEQLRNQMKMREKELKDFEGRWKVVEGEAKGMRAELDTQKKVVDSLKKALAGSGWDEEKEKSAEISLREVRKRVNELQEVELVVILFRPAC